MIGPRQVGLALVLAVTGCDDGAGRQTAPVDAGGGGVVLDAGGGDASTPGEPGGRAVKVMIINMAFLEGQGFIDGLGLTRKIAVSGLFEGAPSVLCNADNVCQMTTGMGYANAAASVAALLYRSGFNLTHAYFIVAGIAGVDPSQGTIASAAWARFVVDYGYSNEIDAREMPEGWPYGYFGVGAAGPSDPPSNDYDAAVFRLNEDLVQAAYALSRDVVLDDSPAAARSRANYASAPANQPPKVIQCDVVSSDTWFAGAALNARARDWTAILTGGEGVYCMSAQEDNATLEVLARGAAAGKVDMRRVAVLRTASDFGEPCEGQSDAEALVDSMQQGGLAPSTSNLYKAAGPLIDAIVNDWDTWHAGVPVGVGSTPTGRKSSPRRRLPKRHQIAIALSTDGNNISGMLRRASWPRSVAGVTKFVCAADALMETFNP